MARFKVSGLRRPRTTQERRNSCYMENPDIEDTLHRAKRNFANIPNAYDDIWACRSKCWKDNGRPKYRPNRKKMERVFDKTSWREYHLFYDRLHRKGYYFETRWEGYWNAASDLDKKFIIEWWE